VKLPRPVRCAIFDLDGVLLDTEHFYTEVTDEICRQYGKRFDWSIKRNMIGRP
jgi:pseudouridine-5'-monophosphatase